jgi:H-type lectin domain
VTAIFRLPLGLLRHSPSLNLCKSFLAKLLSAASLLLPQSP